MWILNLILKVVFHLLPVNILDKLVNSSLPKTESELKIFSKINPVLFEYVSQKKVLYLFQKAAVQVPAYKRFLQEKNIASDKISKIKDFEELVPQTTKSNYVKMHSLADRCYDGLFPQKGYLEESSGTCGNPTFWIKSLNEENESLSMTKASINYLYGFKKGEKVLILNCYLMGGWTGGLRFASRMGNLGIVKNIGPDPQKVIQCLMELGSEFTYLIGAYPPFVVDLLDFVNKPDQFNWNDYTIHILSGGEGFVEEWREYVYSKLKKGALIYSDYGAIDLDVGISTETPFSVVVRKLINTDRQLRQKILASDRLPVYIGQYAPTKYYIGNTLNSESRMEPEITVLNLKSVSPKIKYVIGDEGEVVRFSALMQILEQSGYSVSTLKKIYQIPIIVPFPLLCIYGRSDGTVTINGAIISPSEINRAILSDPDLVSAIHSFKLSVTSDTQNKIRLFIYLEIRKDLRLDALSEARYGGAILNSLLESNECFRIDYEKNPETHKPLFEFVPFQSGIFSSNKDYAKNNYIK